MSKRGYRALEAVASVIAAVAAQAVIRSLFKQATEPLWGILDGLLSDRTGQLVLLGFVALAAMALAGWAHTRQKPRTAQPGETHDRETA
ncbi:hypothetical protein GCM10022222_78660 [Amycolatopsis ultiminotia]|uniref:Uncharacterized protein n=1 Tax=Amycolatopsis ultiminotia TaxID=543629 RepID=A0ABP6YJY7_9PSEU